jgi:lysophospholipase L1-like esterase
MHGWTLWPIRELFAEFCRAEGVPCVDLTAGFQYALEDGGQPFAPTDTHWSADGHDLAAQMVKAKLDELGWLE